MLIVFALAGVTAFFAEAQIYQQLIVPQLPELDRVPLWWWFGSFLPPIVVFLFAGWHGRTVVRAVAFAAAAFLPARVAIITYAAFADVPIGHDLWVGDLAFWSSTVLEFVFWLLIGLAGVGARKTVHRMRHAT
jgi:hypothetical protein